jgi:hypothetical protein
MQNETPRQLMVCSGHPSRFPPSNLLLNFLEKVERSGERQADHRVLPVDAVWDGKEEASMWTC